MEPSKAAMNAIRILKQEFNLVLIDSTPWTGRFDKYPLNILNPIGRNGAELKVATLKFHDKSLGKNMDINLIYNLQNGNFQVREASGRVFTDKNGNEAIIMEAEFFNVNSRNHHKTPNGDGTDTVQYVFGKTNEVITLEDYKKLPAKTNDRIETYARAHICEIFRDYMLQCQYKMNPEKIKDVRPSKDFSGIEIYVQKYLNEDFQAVASEVNGFVNGKRGIQATVRKAAVIDEAKQEQQEPLGSSKTIGME